MKIKNLSGNTIYLEDIDYHLLYHQDKIIDFSCDILKKSRDLRTLIVSPLIEVVEYNHKEQTEKSLVYNKQKHKNTENTEKETELINSYIGIHVKIRGIFYEAGGYGKVNRYLAKNLHDAGINVKIEPKKGQNQLNEDELKHIVCLENTTLPKTHISIDSIIPSFSEVSTAKYKILYTTVEAYSLPTQFIECCQQYNEIWTTCVTPESIVETPNGPKRIDSLSIGDQVWTELGSTRPITEIRRSPYVGKLVYLKASGHEIKMTPWHRLLVKKMVDFDDGLSKNHGYIVITKKSNNEANKQKTVKFLLSPPEYVAADEIKEGDRVLSAKRIINENHICEEIDLLNYVDNNWKEDNKGILFRSSLHTRNKKLYQWYINRTSKIPRMVRVTEELAMILGLYAAKGSSDGNSLSWVMSIKEKQILKKISKLLHRFGLHTNLRTKKGASSLELRCSNRLLSELFGKIIGIGASNKKIPDFIFRCSKNVKISFLKGLLIGDGCFSGNKIKLTVVSKPLRDGCASLFMDLGLLPSMAVDYKLRLNRKWNIQRKHPSYSVLVGGKQLFMTELAKSIGLYKKREEGNRFFSDDMGKWHKVTNISQIDYSGEVFDLTIEKDHTFALQGICSHNSPFAANILKEYIKDKPIFIFPTGVDPDIYNENVIPVKFNPAPKNFVFMSVFGWSYRKGYDLLLKSYFKEFSDNDPVSLLLFTRYMQSTKQTNIDKINKDIDKIASEFPGKNLPHYKVISKIIPEKTMPAIYKACNAFVMASRGESTGMPPCEASLCGLPVIMTNCSGQTIFLKHNNSFLIEPDKIEVLLPNMCHIHYWDGQKFPSLRSQKCVDDFAGFMRYVYENYEDAKNRNRNLQKLLLNNYTWKHAANAIVKRLTEINKKVNM